MFRNPVGSWLVTFKDRLKKLLQNGERPLAILTGAITLTIVLVNLDFHLLEANLYDLRVARGLQKHADADIALVALDESTTKALDDFAPLPLSVHAKFMESLERLAPKAVGYLIDMSKVNQMAPEQFQTEWANRFVSAARRLEDKGSVILLGTRFDVTGEVVPPYPLSILPHSLAVIHKDGNVFAEDKVTRRAFSYLYDKPVFHLELAQRLGVVEPGTEPRGSLYVPEIDGQILFFRYHGSTVMNTKEPASESYRRVSFLDVLNGTLPDNALAGKIVLVGTLLREDSADYTATPYSKSPYVNPKLVVHANILDSILHDDGIVRAPGWVNWVVTFCVTAFVLWWVLTSTPMNGVFATLGLAVGFLFTGQLLFQFQGWWIRESQPLVGLFVSYYLVVPYRLIREYKKRWEYQRKNEILTQVEELKTNFMSLVTHDLKTPVARIQGLAEVLLKKAAARLVTADRETLQHIISATEELNHFISSILELSKIESNRVYLRLESKDINQLIERCAEGFKASAKSRQITVTLKLEPLFPIKIDSSLISKVLNNLIDNAIKYSPSQSEIVIESREEQSWVIIAVQDQGIGLTAEERANLFSRFYRAKNDTTTRITGTGLGLYLTKYFIEAHQGYVEVDSEKDKGSVFKIYLPLESGQGTVPGLTGAGAASGVASSVGQQNQPVGVKEREHV